MSGFDEVTIGRVKGVSFREEEQREETRAQSTMSGLESDNRPRQKSEFWRGGAARGDASAEYHEWP